MMRSCSYRFLAGLQIVLKNCANLPTYGAIYKALAISTTPFCFVRKQWSINDLARLAQR
jgi:hypothetical protein